MDHRENATRIDAEIHRRANTSTDPFAAAVRATRMPMLITDPHQPDNPIVFVNHAFIKLTGYERDEIIGSNCRFLQGSDTNRDDVAKLRHAIECRKSIELDLINYKKSGERFWNRLLISPVFGEEGELTYFFASQFDVTLQKERLAKAENDRAELEQAVGRRTLELTRSEDHLRFILKAGSLGYWTLDLADMRLVASDVCKENFGRLASDPFTYTDLISAVYEEDRDRMQTAVKASIENKIDYDIEYRLITPDGDIRWVHVKGRTSYSAGGVPLSMAGVSSDITDRKRGEEHREFLAAELNHRVKNSMATMQSIAHQTLRNSSTVEQALSDLDARLSSLASAHDVLTRESWDGAAIEQIAAGALDAFRSKASDRIMISGPAVWLDPQRTLALVMAIHELATNAVKYGALSGDAGHVELSWDVAHQEGDRRLRIRWEEAGGPVVTPPTRRGFRTRMIEKALAAEFGGNARLQYLPEGLLFEVDAPLQARGA